MKISARNKLLGKVVALEQGAVNCLVKIELESAPIISAMITNDAVEELELALGREACVVVKASNVMVGICNEGAGCAKPSAGDEVP